MVKVEICVALEEPNISQLLTRPAWRNGPNTNYRVGKLVKDLQEIFDLSVFLTNRVFIKSGMDVSSCY